MINKNDTVDLAKEIGKLMIKKSEPPNSDKKSLPENAFGRSLLHGKGNVLSYFIKLYEVTQAPEHLPLIENYLADLKKHLQTDPYNNYSYFSGKIGLGYTVMKGSTLLNRVIDPASELSFTTARLDRYLRAKSIDDSLAYGRAGTLLGLLKMYEISPSPLLREWSEMTLMTLLKNTITRKEGIFWKRFDVADNRQFSWTCGGYGIGYVLSEVAYAFDSAFLQDLAKEAFDFETFLDDNNSRSTPVYDAAFQHVFEVHSNDPDTTFQNKIGKWIASARITARQEHHIKTANVADVVRWFGERKRPTPTDLLYVLTALGRRGGRDLVDKRNLLNENVLFFSENLHAWNSQDLCALGHCILQQSSKEEIESFIAPTLKRIKHFPLDDSTLMETYAVANFPKTWSRLKSEFPERAAGILSQRKSESVVNLEKTIMAIQVDPTPAPRTDIVDCFAFEKLQFDLLHQSSIPSDNDRVHLPDALDILSKEESKLATVAIQISGTVRIFQREQEKLFKPNLDAVYPNFEHLLQNYGRSTSILYQDMNGEVAEIQLDFLRTLTLDRFEQGNCIENASKVILNFVTLQKPETTTMLLSIFQLYSLSSLHKEIQDRIASFVKDCIGTGILVSSGNFESTIS